MKYTFALATALATTQACTSFDAALGATDTFGDTCHWYDDGIGCGNYDSDSFNSWDMCCGCGGGGEQAVWYCEDASFGFTDTFGDGCSWYAGNEESCGSYDTDLFWANIDCCECGAGWVTAWDTNYLFATDTWGDGCEWYDSNPDTCGAFDDSDFVADILCGSCNQYSSSVVAVVVQASTCVSTDALLGGVTDSYDDGCEWYADGISCFSGAYDDSDFTASSMCCGCGGGVEQASWQCEDASFGFTDTWGDSCSWYAGNESYCGDYDTDLFWANIDCCECGAGWVTIVDTAGAATDSFGDGCDWYDSNTGSCGTYDDNDFWANTMCGSCVHAASLSVAAVSLASSTCEHSSWGATDSYGDGCSWYDDGIGCGNYDDWDFVASSMCCGCGGGYSYDYSYTCTDTAGAATDSYGDSCSWYTGGTGCGSYDDWDFSANTMCCGCGGGSSGVCTDTAWGATDSYGDNCSWYANNPSSCGNFDTWDFTASWMCCECGGGSTWVALAAKEETTTTTSTSTFMYAGFAAAILAVIAW